MIRTSLKTDAETGNAVVGVGIVVARTNAKNPKRGNRNKQPKRTTV
jgi:hypothetical protein